MELVSGMAEACLAVQAVEVEVEILLVRSEENWQVQAGVPLSSAEEKMHLRILFDLEKLVRLAACGDQLAVEAPLLVDQDFEEIMAFFA